MALYRLLLTLWSFGAVTNAATLLPHASTSSDISTSLARNVYQFANGTWVENITSRDNGNLLVTLVDRPELYEINPQDNDSARLIHRFEGYTSLFGIAEASKDVFIVAAGNFSLTAGTVPQSFAIWKVNLSGQADDTQVTKVADMPDAIFLNGITALQKGSNAVLVSDSTQGIIYRVNVETGKYSVALRDETLSPPKNASFLIGINGIRLHGQHLYYANTFQQLFGRVPVDRSTGKATGAYEVIDIDFAVDDFAIHGREEAAYVAAGPINKVFKIGPNGKSSLVAGQSNSTLVAGATSMVFGKTLLDKDVLYITTSGGQASVLDGISIEGGKVVALHVDY